MAERTVALPPNRRIELRIGINLGEVIIDGDGIYGDGVNIAARLQNLAERGGIYIFRQAFDQVEAKLDLSYRDVGERRLKNIAKMSALTQSTSIRTPPTRRLCQGSFALRQDIRFAGPPRESASRMRWSAPDHPWSKRQTG